MQCNSELRIMYWNAQGINTLSKKVQLQQVLKAKYIDIIFLCETFLNEESSFSLPGFRIFRRDRTAHGGGVAIAVKNNLKVKSYPNYTTKGIENVSVELIMENRSLVLTSVYCPKFDDKFKDDIIKITPTNREYIICGDLNAKHLSWNCAKANTAGNVLYNLQLRSTFFIHYPSGPTRYPQSSRGNPTTIDLMLTNSNLHISPLLAHDNILPSDHCPVTFSIEAQARMESTTKLDLKNADWNQFKLTIENHLANINVNNLSTTNHIDNALKIFNRSIAIARSTIPQKDYTPYLLKISSNTELCIRTRNKYKRQLQRTSDIFLKTTLHSTVKQLNKLIEINVNKDRNENWNKFLSQLPIGSKRFWRITKAFRGKKGNKMCSLKQNDQNFDLDTDKTRLIADQFEKAHKITSNMKHSVEKKVVKLNREIDLEEIDISDSENLITVEEIKQQVMRLKNNKAPGLDGILNLFMKKLPEIGYIFLKNIFNACLKLSYFPSSFKCAKVVAIHKRGKDPRLTSSYRPISLLSCIDKIFEKLILSRINVYVAENNLINKEQFGFRHQHSTVHQIKRITNMIKRNKQQRLSTGIILMDIEKAFDSIWHDGLIYKLKNYGFPLYIVKIIKSFLAERSFKVFINNTMSSVRNIPAGVPQGAVLSPTLYSLYVADFSPRRGTDIALYADDLALLAKGKVSNAIVGKLKKSLDSCIKYYNKWKIKINTDKTQAILFPFNRSPKRVPSIPLRDGNNIIKFDDTVKYLGVYLDKKLTYKKHIDHAVDKAMKCFRALYPILNKKSKLNANNKIIIYKTVIRPILLYGSFVWGKAAKTHIKKMQVVQNKALKIIFKLPRLYRTRDLHLNYSQQTIKDVIDTQNLLFSDRCRNSEYDLINHLSEDTS